MMELDNADLNSYIYALSTKSKSVISISGKSGTGKTTLALQIVGSILTSENPSDGSCVWVQASEIFAKKRLISLYRNFPDKISYLLNNTYVYPKSKPFSNYRDQSTFFRNLGTNLLPADVRFLVVDNISHHLRFAVSLQPDAKRRALLHDEFFNSQLFPLIMQCLREKIVLILIHEVSFDPTSGKTLPFFNKLYSRIQTVSISLSTNFLSKVKAMEIDCGDISNGRKLNYEIRDNGISQL